MTDEERKNIIEKIDFEEKWLLDVYAKEYKVSYKDIQIAMSGIRSVVSKPKEEYEPDDWDSLSNAERDH